MYKSWEPFKKIKNRSKWLDLPRAIGLNWLPQNIGFNTEMTRSYYELQERDMEATENSQLPLTFSEQFLWNREFTLRWDLTRNLHMNFQSATHSQIEEPYTPVNKDLYPDQYSAWKDSVWTSIRHLGTPLDYQQSFNASLFTGKSDFPANGFAPMPTITPHTTGFAEPTLRMAPRSATPLPTTARYSSTATSTS